MWLIVGAIVVILALIIVGGCAVFRFWFRGPSPDEERDALLG
jgi:hypothetical protein